MPKAEKKQIRTVVVFCSSRMGIDPIYAQHAAELGRLLGQNGFDLVYGGGSSGLMGVVSKAARENGSKVTGIITHAFRNSAFYEALPGAEERAVRTLHARKAQMLAKADAVLVLAGGIGTLDEQWEAAALIDMNMAANSKSYLKPIIVLNTKGIYDYQKQQMRKQINEGFIHPGRERMIRSVDLPQQVIEKLNTWNIEGIMRACDLTAQGNPRSIQPKVA